MFTFVGAYDCVKVVYVKLVTTTAISFRQEYLRHLLQRSIPRAFVDHDQDNLSKINTT